MFEMAWQDVVLSIGNFVFFLALLPSIFSMNKPSFWTSFMTASMLSVFSYTFYTLDLTVSTFAIGATALAWWTLAFQKLHFKTKEHAPHPRED